MRNFDIIKDIDGLETIHRYCAIAEDFQATNPMISVQQARLALETMQHTPMTDLWDAGIFLCRAEPLLHCGFYHVGLAGD